MSEKKEEAKEKEEQNLEDVFGKKKKKKKSTSTKEEKTEEKVTEPAEPEEKNEDKSSKNENNTEEDEIAAAEAAALKLEDENDTKGADILIGDGEVKKEATETKTRKELENFPFFVDRQYTYEELLARLFSMIQRPEEKVTVKIKPPIVHKEGTTRTAWVNFPQICASINRSAEHVLQFVLAECASTGSLDGNGRLLIRGRFQQKHMERILRHYIVEYVQCHTCKSLETKLQKENRLLFMKCDSCGSTRSVAQIKAGFQATTRATRRTQNKQT